MCTVQLDRLWESPNCRRSPVHSLHRGDTLPRGLGPLDAATAHRPLPRVTQHQPDPANRREDDRIQYTACSQRTRAAGNGRSERPSQRFLSDFSASRLPERAGRPDCPYRAHLDSSLGHAALLCQSRTECRKKQPAFNRCGPRILTNIFGTISLRLLNVIEIESRFAPRLEASRAIPSPSSSAESVRWQDIAFSTSASEAPGSYACTKTFARARNIDRISSGCDATLPVGHDISAASGVPVAVRVTTFTKV